MWGLPICKGVLFCNCLSCHGGAGNITNGTGVNGGSGVIILSVPTTNYSGTQSNATVTTSGSNTILTYTASGSYTA